MASDGSQEHSYAGREFYFGRGRSPLCDRITIIAQPGGRQKLNLIDLGCGDGRDSLYFASRGFEVTAVDVSEAALADLTQRAANMGVQLTTVHESILSYTLRWHYDVVFSNKLHYIPEWRRASRLHHLMDHTAPEGLHGFTVLVHDPSKRRPPDLDNYVYPFQGGELLGFYDCWEVLYYQDEIVNCSRGGTPHQHTYSHIIARRK